MKSITEWDRRGQFLCFTLSDYGVGGDGGGGYLEVGDMGDPCHFMLTTKILN